MNNVLFNKAKEIAVLISSNHSGISFKHNELTLPNNDKFKALAASNGIGFKDDVDCIILDIKGYLESTSFYCFEEMQKGITKVVFQNSFFIFSKANPFYSYFNSSSKLFIPSVNSSSEFNQSNNQYLYYFRVLNALLNSNFNDHTNEANKQLVFYSNSNGILKINYNLEPVISNITYEYKTLETFENYSSNDLYKTFLINSFYSISKNPDNILNIKEIIEQLEILNNTAYRNQELVSKQFDFENFKKKLFKEKEKYFISIRELISKIVAQIIGLPISIATVAVTAYKVKLESDKTLLQYVFGALIIYIVYFLVIQVIYFFDLIEIEKDFNRDFRIISTESGISNDDINLEHQKVKNKIFRTKLLSGFLLVMIVILGILVSQYVYKIAF